MRRRGGERGGSPSGQGCRGVEQRVWNWQQHLARDNGRVRGKSRHTIVGTSQLSLESLWVDATAASTLGCWLAAHPCLSPQDEASSHLPGVVFVCTDCTCLPGVLSQECHKKSDCNHTFGMRYCNSLP